MENTDKLSKNQIDKAKKWYVDHKEHVDKLFNILGKMYPPTEIEDKNNPALWKAEHWKWFLTVFNEELEMDKAVEAIENKIDEVGDPKNLNKMEYLKVLERVLEKLKGRMSRLHSEIDKEVDEIGSRH
jgi:hypothetical protein